MQPRRKESACRQNSDFFEQANGYSQLAAMSIPARMRSCSEHVRLSLRHGSMAAERHGYYSKDWRTLVADSPAGATCGSLSKRERLFRFLQKIFENFARTPRPPLKSTRNKADLNALSAVLNKVRARSALEAETEMHDGALPPQKNGLEKKPLRRARASRWSDATVTTVVSSNLRIQLEVNREAHFSKHAFGRQIKFICVREYRLHETSESSFQNGTKKTETQSLDWCGW